LFVLRRCKLTPLHTNTVRYNDAARRPDQKVNIYITYFPFHVLLLSSISYIAFVIQYSAIEPFMIIACANIRERVDKPYKKVNLCNNTHFIYIYIYIYIYDIDIKMMDRYFCEKLFIIKYLEIFQQGRLKFCIKHKPM